MHSSRPAVAAATPSRCHRATAVLARAGPCTPGAPPHLTVIMTALNAQQQQHGRLPALCQTRGQASAQRPTRAACACTAGTGGAAAPSPSTPAARTWMTCRRCKCSFAAEDNHPGACRCAWGLLRRAAELGQLANVWDGVGEEPGEGRGGGRGRIGDGGRKAQRAELLGQGVGGVCVRARGGGGGR